MTTVTLEEEFNPLNLLFTDYTSDDDYIIKEILGIYKPDTWELTPNNVLLEIGGHIGEISMTCAKKYGCKVVVYEPSPKNYAKLTKNIELNGLTDLIETHQIAISSKIGETVFYEDTRNTGFSGLGYRESAEEIIVEVTTLKYAIEQIRMKGGFIQVLLMDCEGSEFEILRDLTPLFGIAKFRGEFHSTQEENEELLAKIRMVIPDSKIIFAK